MVIVVPVLRNILWFIKSLTLALLVIYPLACLYNALWPTYCRICEFEGLILLMD